MTFEELVAKYALPVIVMALVVMVIIGIVKIFTKMLPPENSKVSKVMSYIYVILVPILSFGVVCAYTAILKIQFEWLTIFKQTAAVWSSTQALYPIYRDLGGRALLLKVLSLFKGKDKKADEVITAIEKVLVLTSSQKEAIKEKLTEKK
jgi:hypothetical protein